MRDEIQPALLAAIVADMPDTIKWELVADPADHFCLRLPLPISTFQSECKLEIYRKKLQLLLDGLTALFLKRVFLFCY